MPDLNNPTNILNAFRLSSMGQKLLLIQGFLTEISRMESCRTVRSDECFEGVFSPSSRPRYEPAAQSYCQGQKSSPRMLAGWIGTSFHYITWAFIICAILMSRSTMSLNINSWRGQECGRLLPAGLAFQEHLAHHCVIRDAGILCDTGCCPLWR